MLTYVGGELEALAEAHKALGDLARLRILQILPRNTSEPGGLFNVNQLSQELGMAQPTVSHHLKVLKQAGLIRAARRSNNVYYYLDAPRLRRVWRELNRDVLRQ